MMSANCGHTFCKTCCLNMGTCIQCHFKINTNTLKRNEAWWSEIQGMSDADQQKCGSIPTGPVGQMPQGANMGQHMNQMMGATNMMMGMMGMMGTMGNHLMNQMGQGMMGPQMNMGMNQPGMNPGMNEQAFNQGMNQQHFNMNTGSNPYNMSSTNPYNMNPTHSTSPPFYKPRLCPVNDSMTWQQNSKACSKCKSIMNKTGWNCTKCNYKECDACAHTEYPWMVCPNNDKTAWLTNSVACAKCTSIMNKKGFFCSKCNYKICDKCCHT